MWAVTVGPPFDISVSAGGWTFEVMRLSEAREYQSNMLNP